jgi:hypothetical protein
MTLSTQSDTKFLDQPPRAVRSYFCPLRAVTVATFIYHDGTEYEIVCDTPETTAHAQHLAHQIRAFL